MDENPVILFDGICNLCNAAVKFVLKHDKKKIFRFASLQSEAGKTLLAKYVLPSDNINSFVLIKSGKAYTRSSAALRVAQSLSGPLKILYGFIIVPPFLRDAVYNVVSNNRYKWFGQKESCMIPTPDLADRFLN